MKTKIKNNIIKQTLSFIAITLGATLAAFSLEGLLVPNNILDGGITGVSIIISKIFDFPLSMVVPILNIPFLYIGYKHLGKRFLCKATYSMIVFALLLKVFHGIPLVTEEILLATVFGGVLLGIGVGTVLRYGGCLDGTESVGLVISKKTSFSVGQIVFIFNLFIYSISAIFFGLESAMYSLLTYFITFKVIDFVAEGLEAGKAALIITSEEGKIEKQIYEKLGRTVTTIEGKGLLSGKKSVLYCVITRLEVSELRRIVEEEDGKAFVTITDVSEIIGNHIKSTKMKEKIKS